MALPGSNKFTNIIPSNKLISEALINHNSVLPPIRPTAFISPNLATPTTSVVNTNGATIIFINLKKTSASIVNQSSFLSRAFRLSFFWRDIRFFCCTNVLYALDTVSVCAAINVFIVATESPNIFTKRSCVIPLVVLSKVFSAAFF